MKRGRSTGLPGREDLLVPDALQRVDLDVSLNVAAHGVRLHADTAGFRQDQASTQGRIVAGMRLDGALVHEDVNVDGAILHLGVLAV